MLTRPGGASDGNSGTAVLVELSKAFGELLKQGWKPKRTMYISPRPILQSADLVEKRVGILGRRRIRIDRVNRMG